MLSQRWKWLRVFSATRRFKVKLHDIIKAQEFTTTGSHQRMSDVDSDSATAK
jgi:hypothetical protein